MKCVVRYSSHLRNTYSDASQAGVSLKPMEIAMVRVIFVLRAFILFFLLWTFFVAMIVNAYYHVALRCRNKQSIIKASEGIKPGLTLLDLFLRMLTFGRMELF